MWNQQRRSATASCNNANWFLGAGNRQFTKLDFFLSTYYLLLLILVAESQAISRLWRNIHRCIGSPTLLKVTLLKVRRCARYNKTLNMMTFTHMRRLCSQIWWCKDDHRLILSHCSVKHTAVKNSPGWRLNILSTRMHICLIAHRERKLRLETHVAIHSAWCHWLLVLCHFISCFYLFLARDLSCANISRYLCEVRPQNYHFLIASVVTLTSQGEDEPDTEIASAWNWCCTQLPRKLW